MKTQNKVIGLSLALTSLAVAEYNYFWVEKAFPTKSWKTERSLLPGAHLPPIYTEFLNQFGAKVTYIDGSIEDFAKQHNIVLQTSNTVYASWLDSNKTLYYSRDVSYWLSWDINTPLHEIGHILYDAAGVGSTSSFAKKPFITRIWEENNTKEHPNSLFASTYYRNENEFFAEGFAWYYHSDHTRKLLFSKHKGLFGLMKLLENVIYRREWKDQPAGSQMVYSTIIRGEINSLQDHNLEE